MRRMLLALLGGSTAFLLLGSLLYAQPSPPTRFYGTLTIDGAPAPAGTMVRAFVGDKDCTNAREPFTVPAGSYAVEVGHTTQTPGCGEIGTTVTFRVGTRTANERGTFETGSFQLLNLTVSGTGAVFASPTPTATPTPAPTASPTPVTPPPPAAITTARLDLGSPCLPVTDQPRCDANRLALWTGQQAAWEAEMARRGQPTPSADDLFTLTYEYRIAAGDPAAIASIAKGLGWPKIYISELRFRGTAPAEADEYVELTNVGSGSQDMTGWRVHSASTNIDFYFSDGTVLEGGAKCRFYTSGERADSCPGTINVSASGVWDNNADAAELWYDPLALLADATRYVADPNNQPPPPNLQVVRAQT